jgi:alkanesulfonate monooxygenase SsuD/methylene tetrahydromethanopterin reductase-like flavin-dependent oxidoreductase (luciferase family)
LPRTILGELPVVHVGLALWSMQRTQAVPRPGWPQLYADLQDDASLCEELGFDSLWVAEHRFWYDGWCPQPLVAAAAALGATDRLTVGTAMHLLPQHDPARSADTYAQLRSLFGDRFELGVGLGYRDEEYDGVGLARNRRGRLMDTALDEVISRNHHGRIWVGGMAPAAIERAAGRGLSLLLPPTLTPADIQRVAKDAAEVSAAAGFEPGRIGMVKDLWITDGTDAAKRQHLDRLDAHYREYGGSWWMLRGALGFARPDLLDKQMQRTADTALVGPLEQIVDELHQLVEAGVSTIALGLSGDFTRGHYRDQMELVAAEVLPALTAAT